MASATTGARSHGSPHPHTADTAAGGPDPERRFIARRTPALVERIRHDDADTVVGHDHHVSKLHAVAAADLAGVQLDAQHHVRLDHAIGVRLEVAGVRDARTLLLETETVDHHLVPLLERPRGDARAALRDLGAGHAGPHESLHRAEPLERLAVDRTLLGARYVADGERPGDAEERALDADRVRVDPDEVAVLEHTIGRLAPPRVRVRTRADGARREVLAAAAQEDVAHGREQVPLPHAGRDRVLERREHLEDDRAVDVVDREFLGRLHVARPTGDGERVDDLDAETL
jgi:hypothetical protein